MLHDLSRPFGIPDAEIIRRDDQHRQVHAGVQDIPEAALNAGGAVNQDKIMFFLQLLKDFPEMFRLQRLGSHELGGGKQLQAFKTGHGEQHLFRRAVPVLKVNQGELPLLTLVRRVAATEGITRVRLGSLEPRIMTEEVVSALAGIDKLCPQFHLSLQSGCDETLKAMNRHYTTAEYHEVTERLRRHFDDPAITTDIIAGFPGETEEQFETTVSYVHEIGFAQVHVFPYSRRKGTVADRMSGQHTEAEKKRRAGIIAGAASETMRAYRERRLHFPLDVLLEEPAVIDGIDCFVGYSREYVPVAIPVDAFSGEPVSGSELTVRGARLLSDGTILADSTL